MVFASANVLLEILVGELVQRRDSPRRRDLVTAAERFDLAHFPSEPRPRRGLPFAAYTEPGLLTAPAAIVVVANVPCALAQEQRASLNTRHLRLLSAWVTPARRLAGPG
jgi:hypothetical protein